MFFKKTPAWSTVNLLSLYRSEGSGVGPKAQEESHLFLSALLPSAPPFGSSGVSGGTSTLCSAVATEVPEEDQRCLIATPGKDKSTFSLSNLSARQQLPSASPCSSPRWKVWLSSEKCPLLPGLAFPLSSSGFPAVGSGPHGAHPLAVRAGPELSDALGSRECPVGRAKLFNSEAEFCS